MRFSIYKIYKFIILCFIFNFNIYFTLFSNNAYINSIAIDADNKILAGGFYLNGNDFNYGANTNFVLARYNIDGTLDTTFNPDGGQPGIVTTTFFTASDFNPNAAIMPEIESVVTNPINPTNPPINIFPNINRNPQLNPFIPVFALPSNNILNNILTNSTINSSSGLLQSALSPAANFSPNVPIIEPIAPDFSNFSAAVYNPLVLGVTPQFTADENINIGYFAPNSSTVTTRIGNIGQNNSEINGIAIDSKGRIVAVGHLQRDLGIINTSNIDNNYFVIVRYNPDGSLDDTFNPQGTGSGMPGVFMLELGLDNVLTSVSIDAEDNIIAAGYLTVSNALSGTASISPASVVVAVIKCLENGSLDDTFNPLGLRSGIPGIVISNISAYPLISQSGLINNANAVTIDGNGKILICGVATISSYTGILVIRYNPDGSLDTTFNPDGINTPAGSVITDATVSGFNIGYSVGRGIKTVEIDGQEKIVITGYMNEDFDGNESNVVVIRYNEDGSLDSTFNPVNKTIESLPGIIITQIGSLSSSANSLDIDSTDLNNIKTVVAGYVSYKTELGFNEIPTDFYYKGTGFLTLRYNQDGTLDNTFGPNGQGYVITDIDNGAVQSGSLSYSFINSVAITNDNEIVSAGGALNNFYTNDFALARYTLAGILDTSFNPAGTPPGTVVTVIDNGQDMFENIFMGGTAPQVPNLTSIDVTPEELAEISPDFSAFAKPIILAPDDFSLVESAGFSITGKGHPKSTIHIAMTDYNTGATINMPAVCDDLGRWATEVKDISDGIYNISAKSKDPVSNLAFNSNSVQVNVKNNKIATNTINSQVNNLKENLYDSLENLNNTQVVEPKKFKLNDTTVNVSIGTNNSGTNNSQNSISNNINLNNNKVINNKIVKNVSNGLKNNKNNREFLTHNDKEYYISYGSEKKPYVVSHKDLSSD